MWSREAKGHTEFERVQNMLRGMLEVQDILHQTARDLFIPEDQCDRIQRNVDGFLLDYQKLAYKADCEKKLLFSNPTKFHMLWHWARRIRYVNSRRTNCYLDEDFVGRLKVLAQSCAVGSDTEQMLEHMFLKYTWAQHFMARDCVGH